LITVETAANERLSTRLGSAQIIIIIIIIC
jgi:hypothetical protein